MGSDVTWGKVEDEAFDQILRAGGDSHQTDVAGFLLKLGSGNPKAELREGLPEA